MQPASPFYAPQKGFCRGSPHAVHNDEDLFFFISLSATMISFPKIIPAAVSNGGSSILRFRMRSAWNAVGQGRIALPRDTGKAFPRSTSSLIRTRRALLFVSVILIFMVHPPLPLGVSPFVVYSIAPLQSFVKYFFQKFFHLLIFFCLFSIERRRKRFYLAGSRVAAPCHSGETTHLPRRRLSARSSRSIAA